MKIKVDREKCMGCGICTALNRDIFKLDEDNKAIVKKPDSSEDIKMTVGSCPTQAISVDK